MNSEEYNTLLRQAAERRLSLRQNKGAEYTRGGQDVLANFKRIGHDLGIDPLKVWYTYAGKHWDAIGSYCKSLKTHSNESIQGRIDDMVVYLDLLLALVAESESLPGVPKEEELKMALRSILDGLDMENVKFGSAVAEQQWTDRLSRAWNLVE